MKDIQIYEKKSCCFTPMDLSIPFEEKKFEVDDNEVIISVRKKKVKKYRWVAQYPTGKLFITENPYENHNDFFNSTRNKGVTFLQPIKETEITE